MTSNEAATIVHKRVCDALAEFKRNYPGPYLDRSRAGLIVYKLEECVAHMEDCVDEVKKETEAHQGG